ALAVADLLSPIRSDRIAMVMPDERRGAESQMPAALLQSPADVHVVAGLGVSRIEAAHLFERPPAKGHIASRNVLGDRIVEGPVPRASGPRREPWPDPTAAFRRDVGPAPPNRVGRQERLNEICQPVRVDARIGVGVSDDLARRGAPPKVTRGAQTAV